jgi:hypothetical protein
VNTLMVSSTCASIWVEASLFSGITMLTGASLRRADRQTVASVCTGCPKARTKHDRERSQNRVISLAEKMDLSTCKSHQCQLGGVSRNQVTNLNWTALDRGNTNLVLDEREPRRGVGGDSYSAASAGECRFPREWRQLLHTR